MQVFHSLLLAALLTTAAHAADSADDIMHRVAENQDRLQAERTQFVYDQNIRVTSRHGGGKLISEQDTQYAVAPSEKTSTHTMLWTKLKYWHDGRFITTSKDGPEGDSTLDTGLVKSFRDDLLQTDSKDGVDKNLFPLTTEEQKDLEFELASDRTIHDRPAYVINFRPKDHKDFGWAGEAVIDKEDLQPVTVYTRLSRRLPLLVRTMLGSDVPGLGFTTQYTRLDKGIWFPSSFGSEFKIHAVYFFHRTITISMKNDNFRRTNVATDIHYNPVANQ